MQVLPLLTPTHFMENKKKRSRSNEDYESNYFKKRLIATLPTNFKEDDDNDKERTVTPPSKNQAFFNDDRSVYEILSSQHHHHPDFIYNKLSETNNYPIPGFVLSKEIPTYSSAEEAQSGQLILYKPNPLMPVSPPTTPTITELTDDDEDEEEDFEPMDLD